MVLTGVALNRTGATRGIYAEPWNTYVSIVTGSGFAACVDLRVGHTFGCVHTVELTGTAAVFIPAGVGNWYSCPTDLLSLYCVTLGGLRHSGALHVIPIRNEQSRLVCSHKRLDV